MASPIVKLLSSNLLVSSRKCTNCMRYQECMTIIESSLLLHLAEIQSVCGRVGRMCVCVWKDKSNLWITFFSYSQHISFPFTEQRALDGTERELRTLRKNLLHDAEAGELVLVIDGQSVKANPNATKTSNHLDCPPGMAQDHDAICCGKLLCHTQ